MYRIWIGLQPRMVVFGLHSFVAITVLVIHLFAFKVVNYPASIKAKYSQTTAAVEAPAPTVAATPTP
ncbi:MAG: light-harvesting protein [Gemmatimonadaceae bacterium]|jgi:hypothetical protein|nr:light-harvesting protein [Gemmatimonadaceae bacterium]